ncbi:MAG: zinc metallopeptidase, partial [Verrucomicrobiales bacterium]
PTVASIILIISLIPLLLALAARHFFYTRPMRRLGQSEISLSARELARRVLDRAGAKETAITEKRRLFIPLSAKNVLLQSQKAASKKAGDVANAAHLAGLILLARREEKPVVWRTSTVKFGWSFPAFTLLILAFAMVVKAVPFKMGFALVALSCAFASFSLWLTMSVERNAARATARLLEESALLPRREEAEKVALLVRAQAWKRLLPGLLQWLGKE